MSDIDTLLREQLHAAAATTLGPPVERGQVRQAIARRQSRIRRRRATGRLGLVAAAAVALGVGLSAVGDRDAEVVTPSTDEPVPTTTAPACGTPPRFRAAPGWEVTRGSSSTTAANVPLGPGTLAGDAPWDTVEQLTEGDVLLYAMTYPATEDWADDETLFPVRDLPVVLEDAEPTTFEGQPDDVWADRLAVRVDDWIVDVVIFYGNDPAGQTTPPTQPSTSTREAAQEQLALLEIPPPCDATP